MNKLLEVVHDGGGAVSNMRVIALLVAVAVVGTWTAVSVKKMELQPLDLNSVALVLGASGLKVIQSRSE